ncbi:MAG TPA: hypothetical protein PLK94_04295, partial [Alphaproteobacteria bacterium]|nr:hypothetical protein [Alphaproteobacteria bacterium]
ICTAMALGMSPVFAEEKAEGTKSAEKKVTPVTELEETTKEMIENLDDNQLLQFRAIEQSYRTIKAVEDVQSSVTRAVKSCSKANPDLEEEMSTRLRTWRDSIRPSMKEAYKKLDKMVLLQTFTKPSSMRSYLKMFDKAVAYRNQGIETVPVSEKEACLTLKKSMDESEKNLNTLLIQTLALDRPLNTEK